MLDLGLGGTSAPGFERLLARSVGGCVSVWDVEAEGLADVHMGTHERRAYLRCLLVWRFEVYCCKSLISSRLVQR